MIPGIASSSTAYSPLPSARGTNGAKEAFSVPQSALRADGARHTAPETKRPPSASDSVELNNAYLQLLATQNYARPPVQPVREAAAALPEPAAPAAGIPGDPGNAASASPDGQSPEEAADALNPDGAEGSEDPAAAEEEKKANGETLTEEEQQQVQELKTRDREVRAHEQAHQAVGGQYAGGASYEFQQGPDGQRYAVGGEVSIDTSAEREPEATIAKMQVVQAAAMAPAQPSGQDRSVAAAAAATAAEARVQLQQQDAAAPAEGAEGEGSKGEEAEGAQGANGAASAAGAGGASSNPMVQAFRRPRANPYGNAPGVITLPDASRSVDVVA